MPLALAALPPSPDFIPDFAFSRDDELWPPSGTPVPDLDAHGMTEARCVVQFFHGRTTEERLDALEHLANICALKAAIRGFFWQPSPNVKFVGVGTARYDYESADPYSPAQQRKNNAGWFRNALLSHGVIGKFAPAYITKRELMELARIKDPDLLHVCNALVCDLANAAKSSDLRELDFAEESTVPVAVQNENAKPDYKDAVAMLVKNRKLRVALPRKVRWILELVFRKLDGGADPRTIIADISKDIRRDARTIRRYLAQARSVAESTGVSAQLMGILSGLVLNRA